MDITEIKTKQLLNLQEICIESNIDFNSLKVLVEAEKTKKLQRRNHYIHETINNEIEKAIKNEI